MAKKTDDRIILWPEYFDSSLTRAEGRRVPIEYAVSTPSSDDLFRACQKLGLSPELEYDKAHPSRWFEPRGRVKVYAKYNKTKTIAIVAKRLSRKKK
jgi:signal recognition particle subunit SRP19